MIWIQKHLFELVKVIFLEAIFSFRLVWIFHVDHVHLWRGFISFFHSHNKVATWSYCLIVFFFLKKKGYVDQKSASRIACYFLGPSMLNFQQYIPSFTWPNISYKLIQHGLYDILKYVITNICWFQISCMCNVGLNIIIYQPATAAKRSPFLSTVPHDLKHFHMCPLGILNLVNFQ